MKSLPQLLIVSILLLVNACATYKSNMPTVDYESLQGIDKATTNFFLIGDTGQPDDEGNAPKALRELQKHFHKSDKNDWLLFLGDNVYQKGVPAESSDSYKEAKHALDVQLDIVKAFPGRVVLFPATTIGIAA